MEIIDLLNKIANGEEVPKKIKIRNDILVRNKEYHLPHLQDYYYMENVEDATWRIWYYDLNDEVEIIEEDKKIEIIEEDKKIEKLREIADIDGGIAYSWSRTEAKLKTKINEIIDYINKE